MERSWWPFSLELATWVEVPERVPRHKEPLDSCQSQKLTVGSEASSGSLTPASLLWVPSAGGHSLQACRHEVHSPLCPTAPWHPRIYPQGPFDRPTLMGKLSPAQRSTSMCARAIGTAKTGLLTPGLLSQLRGSEHLDPFIGRRDLLSS